MTSSGATRVRGLRHPELYEYPGLTPRATESRPSGAERERGARGAIEEGVSFDEGVSLSGGQRNSGLWPLTIDHTARPVCGHVMRYRGRKLGVDRGS